MPLIEPFFHWLNYPPIQVPKKIMGKASDLAKTKEEEVKFNFFQIFISFKTFY